MKTISRSIQAGLMLAACLAGVPSAASGAEIPEAGDPPALADGSVRRYVRYRFTMQNGTDQIVPRVELWACAPLRETSTQRVLELHANPACEERTDGLGNQLLVFVFSNVPPYAVRLATVETTLEMRAEPEKLAADRERFLRAEALYEHDNEAFGRLVPPFPKGTTEQTVRAIYDWVRAHLRDTGYDGKDRGALQALTQGAGDCTEYATLFAALCRRAGIPARAVGGYLADRDTLLEPGAYHNWAEYHLDGRWHLVDPLAGRFREKEEQHVATRILGESDTPLGNHPRFRLIGEGCRAEMSKP